MLIGQTSVVLQEGSEFTKKRRTQIQQALIIKLKPQLYEA